jgi:hypothetical protein
MELLYIEGRHGRRRFSGRVQLWCDGSGFRAKSEKFRVIFDKKCRFFEKYDNFVAFVIF